MKTLNFDLDILNIEELQDISGGGLSEVVYKIVKYWGECFMNAGAMAVDGAAAHEIMGFK